MQETTHVVGVDPGLVHTGCVRLVFWPLHHEIQVQHEVVLGLDADKVKTFVEQQMLQPANVFIEGYRPRSNLGTDAEMMAGVRKIAATTRGTVVPNTGVKKTVKRALLELLGIWSFPTSTHHQDLRSAARIAVLGMLKDDGMNTLIADIVRDHQAKRTWRVTHH